MAGGKQTDVAVMDFSKTIDKVDHQRLILKLKRMGINNKTSNWIGAWLSHRFQRVVVDGQLATHQIVVLYCQASHKALSLVHVFSLYT